MRALRYCIFLFVVQLSFAASGPLRVQISPPNSTIVLDVTTSQQLSAQGDFLSTSGAGGKILTTLVIWRSSDPNIATVNASGVVTPVSKGTATITADSGPFHGSTKITVVPNQSVSSLAVTPVLPSVPKGLPQQFTATATYADSSTQDVTAVATWSSSDTTVAAINSTGLASTRAVGPTTISASFIGASNTVSDSTTLTVAPPVLASITVDPPLISMPPGGAHVSFTATGHLTDGTPQDLTATATWNSSATSVATVDSTGHATTIAAGQTTISATVNAITGNATLKVLGPASIQVTPANASIPFAGTQQFTAIATLTDGSQLDITSFANWTTTDLTAVSVNSTGLATGARVGASVTISASLGGVTGSTTVTVTFSNANLNGQYAFLLQGSDSTPEPLIAAGSFQADGQGHLANGMMDLSDASGVSPNQTFTGTYSVAPDGRGTADITGSLGDITFNFVLAANGDAVITQFDSAAVASGPLKKQDPTAFNTAALNATFVFSFSGFSADAFGSVLPMGAVGQLHMDGAGNITSGREDINEAGVLSGRSILNGTYTVANNGRGTAGWTDSRNNQFNFAFYVVSSNQALFVQLDSQPSLAGAATRQSGPLGTAAFQGNYVLTQNGITSDDAFDFDFFPSVAAGIIRPNGAGSIPSGIMDTNDFDAGVTQGQPLTGTYSADSTGRGTATLTTANGSYIFYMVSPTTAYFLSTSSTAVITGTAEQQAPATFSNASLQGNFDLLLNDGLFGGITVSGQFVSDGAGNLSGTEDDNAGALLADIPFSGSYGIDSIGRGTAVLNAGDSTTNFHFYVVSGSQIRFIAIDDFDVVQGSAEKQF